MRVDPPVVEHLAALLQRPQGAVVLVLALLVPVLGLVASTGRVLTGALPVLVVAVLVAARRVRPARPA